MPTGPVDMMADRAARTGFGSSLITINEIRYNFEWQWRGEEDRYARNEKEQRRREGRRVEDLP